MSSRDWKFRIQDIINSIDKIISYTDGKTLSTFKRDQMAVDAVIRNFEIFGEACAHISPSIQKKYPEVPWSQMKGMRNLLIHEYFGVDVSTVWHTARKHLPSLKKQLSEI